MADSNSSGSTGIVAIFAILLMIMVASFIAWRAGVFGGGGDQKSLDIQIHTPGSE